MFYFVAFGFSKAIKVADITDTNFNQQFYIQNQGNYNFLKGEDLNVVPAWEKGYSGTNKTITVLTSGAKLTHLDLKSKINESAVYNFVQSTEEKQKIGTQVLGVAAAEINGKTLVGVAPDAKVGAVTFDTAKEYTADEIGAILCDSQHIKGDVILFPQRIYSKNQQWFDDSLLAFSFAEISAFTSPYILPTGNDGHLGADTSMFPGMCSRFTIPVGASTVRGSAAYYSTGGACVSVSAPGTGLADDVTPEMRDFPKLPVLSATDDEMIDVIDGRTEHAAAEVAAVAALMMEANPALKPDDLQLILQHTATKTDPNSPLWFKNQAGYWYHPKLGFGRVNADLAVETAKKYGNYAVEFNDAENIIDFQSPVLIPKFSEEPDQKLIALEISADETFTTYGSLNIETSNKDLSKLRIELRSPEGSRYTIFNPTSYKPTPGPNDVTITDTSEGMNIGFRCFFGENPNGEWEIYIHHTDEIDNDQIKHIGLSISVVNTPPLPQEAKQEGQASEIGYVETQDPTAETKNYPYFALESKDIKCGTDFKLVKMYGPPENYKGIKVPLYLVDLTSNRTMPVTSFEWEESTNETTVRLPCLYQTGKYGLSARFDHTLYQISHTINLKNDHRPGLEVPYSAKKDKKFNISWYNTRKTFNAPGIYQKVIVAVTDMVNDKVVYEKMSLDNGEAEVTIPEQVNNADCAVSVIPVYCDNVLTRTIIEIPEPTIPTSSATQKPVIPPTEEASQDQKEPSPLATEFIIGVSVAVIGIVIIVIIVLVISCKKRRRTYETSTALNDVLLN